MIYIKNFKRDRIVRSDYDHVYGIVRSAKYMPDGMEQVAALSPTYKLFQDYLKWKRAGEWDMEKFASHYVPQFLADLKHEKAGVGRDWLNKIYKMDKEGKRIALCCFCDDETMCHRSIVAGLLQGVGCNVVCDNDYSGYYKQYRLI